MDIAIKAWKEKGNFLSNTKNDFQIYYQVIGTDQAPPEKTLLILHGFPESSFSFHKVIPGLQVVFERIVVFDFIGFGLSDKPHQAFGYSILEHADTAFAVWKKLEIRGGHLLAHDMGDSVATELATRQVEEDLPAFFDKGFMSITFTNGSMALKYANLRVTQKILLTKMGSLLTKLTHQAIFNHQIKSAHGNQNLCSEDINQLWTFLKHKNGNRIFHLLILYYNDRVRYEATRWLPALKTLKIPIHFCWGDKDAVAPIAIPKYIIEAYSIEAVFTSMQGVGHFGQIANPQVWLENVTAFHTTTLGIKKG